MRPRNVTKRLLRAYQRQSKANSSTRRALEENTSQQEEQVGPELTQLWKQVRAMTLEELMEVVGKVAKRRKAQVWSPRDELAVLEYTRRMNAAQSTGAVRS